MRMFFTGFSPNFRSKEVFVALKFLFNPWCWKNLKNGKELVELKTKISNFFDNKEIVLFDSGRTSLFFALKALGVGKGDEVVVEAYTCVVVVNAIKWVGATPIYVDIKDDLNIDVVDLEKKITDKTKVILIQHTFGNPADIDNILELAKEKNIKTIEDCAHTFGGEYKQKKLGTFADLAIFSLGSDKPISSVRGGFVLVNNDSFTEDLSTYQKDLKDLKLKIILKHLWHAPVFFVGKKLYGLKIGKFFLFFARKIGLINKIIEQKEKQGIKPDYFPAKYPNALAALAIRQLSNIKNINNHRIKIAKIYKNNIKNKLIKHTQDLDNPLLRYHIFVDKNKIFLTFTKGKGLLVGDWYQQVVAPNDTNITCANYQAGSCPKAEQYIESSFNLPTNINIQEEDAKKISDIINSYEG